MGGAGEGSGLGVGAMDEEVRELLLRPRGKTVVQVRFGFNFWVV